jgi:hypothetical protein
MLFPLWLHQERRRWISTRRSQTAPFLLGIRNYFKQARPLQLLDKSPSLAQGPTLTPWCMNKSTVDLSKFWYPRQNIFSVRVIIVGLLDLIELSVRPRIIANSSLILPISPVTITQGVSEACLSFSTTADSPAYVEVYQMRLENLGTNSPIHI